MNLTCIVPLIICTLYHLRIYLYSVRPSEDFKVYDDLLLLQQVIIHFTADHPQCHPLTQSSHSEVSVDISSWWWSSCTVVSVSSKFACAGRLLLWSHLPTALPPCARWVCCLKALGGARLFLTCSALHMFGYLNTFVNKHQCKCSSYLRELFAQCTVRASVEGVIVYKRNSQSQLFKIRVGRFQIPPIALK